MFTNLHIIMVMIIFDYFNENALLTFSISNKTRFFDAKYSDYTVDDDLLCIKIVRYFVIVLASFRVLN